MKPPSAEVTKEALARWYQWDDDDLSIGEAHPFWPMVKAAEAWSRIAPDDNGELPPRTDLIEDFVTELLRGDLINQNSSNIEGEVRQMVLNLTSRWDAELALLAEGSADAD